MVNCLVPLEASSSGRTGRGDLILLLRCAGLDAPLSASRKTEAIRSWVPKERRPPLLGQEMELPSPTPLPATVLARSTLLSHDILKILDGMDPRTLDLSPGIRFQAEI